jgi:hypothetical protein
MAAKETAMRRYIPYFLLTAAIILPLLLPGYILTIDLVFTPELRPPENIANDYLWHTLLFILQQIIPSQIIEKAILAAIPLAAAIGMHRLLESLFTQATPRPTKRLNRSGAGKRFPETIGSEIVLPRVSGLLSGWGAAGMHQQWAIYAASIFYAVNPFTYSRFIAGHYAVLLGYALVPFFVRALLAFIANPSHKTLGWVIGLTLAVSIVSIHTLGSLAVITVIIVALAAWSQRRNRGILKQYLTLGLAGLGVFVLASGYWLIPMALGQNETARTVEQFDQTHTEAFATAGSNAFLQLINVLKLQGFWLESRGQFALPQDQLPGWGTIRLVIWSLVGWGLIWCWRKARPLAIGLSATGAVAVVLAIGVPGGLLTAVGYREPQKFAGLLALVFAVCIAIAGMRLLAWLQQRSASGPALGATGILIAILLFTPTMFWGARGQLTPRSYPDDWHSVNRYLNDQPGTFATLFLPWHQYMSFDFAGRIIANPAEPFFDRPIIASHDPEVGDIKPPMNVTRDSIARRLEADRSEHEDLVRTLRREQVRFVLVAKEVDYRKYDYLRTTEGISLDHETDSLVLYRVHDGKETR